MATVPHVISGLGLRKFQADGFLLTQVYNENLCDKNKVLTGRCLHCCCLLGGWYIFNCHVFF